MRRLAYGAVLTVALLCGAGAPAVAQTDDGAAVTISGVDASAAPEVTLTVAVEGALASQPLDEDAFTLLVSEEDRPHRLTGLPSDPLEVQLVIDTSGSMQGPAIDAARAAAIQLVEELPGSVEVGVVGFGNEPYNVAERTADRAALTRALSNLQADGQTALYDAITVAAGRFETERRVLVVLTDGSDTVSAADLDAAVDALESARTTFYAVALDTPDTDVDALQSLASATGGRVVEAADPDALASVYGSIARQLAALYEISFDAVRTGSTGIVVRVSADGASAEAETRVSVPVAVADEAAAGAPSVRVVEVPAPGLLEREWVVWPAIGAIFGAFLLAGLVVVTRPPVPAQLAAARRIRRAGRASPLHAITDQAKDFAERSLERTGRRRGVERALERAGLDMRPAEFSVLVATVAFATFAVGLLLGGLLVAVVLAAAAIFAARVALGVRAERRQARFAEQLEHTLPLMAGALRAGFGVMQALDAVARESLPPTSEEFRRVITETRLGRDLADSLEALADRVGNDDFTWVVQAIEIHREVGGDLAEVLDKVYATIRERNRIRRHIKALSGEGRFSAIILFLLPIAMFGYISMVNPDYIGELTGRGVGVAMLAVAGSLMVAGGLWMRRLIRLVF